jgi:hypothetical protein
MSKAPEFAGRQPYDMAPRALLDGGVLVEGDAHHHGQGSATMQKQRREDLKQRWHELDDATHISEDLVARLVPRN